MAKKNPWVRIKDWVWMEKDFQALSIREIAAAAKAEITTLPKVHSGLERMKLEGDISKYRAQHAREVKTIKGKLQQLPIVSTQDIFLGRVLDLNVNPQAITAEIKQGAIRAKAGAQFFTDVSPAATPLLGPRSTGPAAARAVLAGMRMKQRMGKERRRANVSQARSKANAISPHPSSWVDALGHDSATSVLYAQLSGKDYYWRPIDESVYDTWCIAADRCRTKDPTGQNRWRPGKTPSLGATWWQTVKAALIGRRIL